MKKIPTFHDGLLVGVEILKEKDVMLRIEDVDGQRSNLRLHRVKYMTINDFSEGNIILDVYVTDRLEDERETIAHLAFGSLDANDSRVSLYIEEALKQHNKLLIIAPSYGAEVIALCADIELIEEGASGEE